MRRLKIKDIKKIDVLSCKDCVRLRDLCEKHYKLVKWLEKK